MYFILGILLLVVVLNFLLGFTIYANKKSSQEILFVIAVVFISIWAIGDAMLLLGSTPAIVGAGLYIFLVAPMAIPLSLWLFSMVYARDNKIINKYNWVAYILFAVSAVIIIASQAKLLIQDVIIIDGLNKLLVYKPGYIIYAIFFVVFFNLVYINLYKSSKFGIEKYRKPATYLLIGIALTSVPALITNLALPLVEISKYIWLGPVFSFISSLFIFLAIARLRLFEVKTTFIKTVTYVFSVVVLALFFGIVISLSVILVSDVSIKPNTQIILALISAFFALLLQPLREFINTGLSKLFKINTYNTEDLLNKINYEIVNQRNYKDLLDSVSNILSKTISAKYLVFYISEKSNIEYHIAGTSASIIKSINPQAVTDLINKKGYENLSTENIENIDLKNKLNNIDAERIVAMNTKDEYLGFMLVGRRLGNSDYTIKDEQLLSIIADSLAVAVQNMLRFEEISKFNITLQQKIDNATKELKDTNEKLKSLDEAKDDFISMASHQMRTPLTSIKGYISMLLEGDAGDLNNQQQNFLNQAFISSQRMVFLISDLLNVSRLKTGKFTIEKTNVDLPGIVESEVEQLNQTAEARGLKLKYTPPKKFPTLQLDETKTMQVIMNFIDNAIYYTPKGGEITIELNTSNTSASLVVKDTGIGVPKKAQHELFTKFYRADNAKKARPDGTGLGLYMAKKVVIAQGGHIIFSSEEGKGSTFGFSFPINKD